MSQSPDPAVAVSELYDAIIQPEISLALFTAEVDVPLVQKPIDWENLAMLIDSLRSSSLELGDNSSFPCEEGGRSSRR